MKKVFAILGLLIFLTGAVGFWRESQRIADIPKADPTIDPDLDGFIPVLLPPSPTREIDEELQKFTQEGTVKPLPGEATTGESMNGYQEDELVVPDRIVIPAIDLDAPIVPAVKRAVSVEGVPYEEWVAPDAFAAGWHTTSAFLGEAGNTVLNGHHNVFGEVFRDLVNLEMGDRINVYAGTKKYQFEITNIMILPERWQSLEKRLENALWMERSDDERLTLITCWPYESNTHRLIIVAQPVSGN